MRKILLLMFVLLLTACSDDTLAEYSNKVSLDNNKSYNFDMKIIGMHKNIFVNEKYVIKNENNEKWFVKNHPDFDKIKSKLSEGYYKDIIIKNDETLILNSNFEYEEIDAFIDFKDTDIFLDLVSELKEIVSVKDSIYKVVLNEKDVYSILDKLELPEKTTEDIIGEIEIIDEQVSAIYFTVNNLKFEIQYSGIKK